MNASVSFLCLGSNDGVEKRSPEYFVVVGGGCLESSWKGKGILRLLATLQRHRILEHGRNCEPCRTFALRITGLMTSAPILKVKCICMRGSRPLCCFVRKSLPRTKPQPTRVYPGCFRLLLPGQYAAPALSRSTSSPPGPPVCAVCADGYTSDIGYACSRCTSGRRAATIAVISVLLLAVVALTVALGVRHLRSRRDEAHAPTGGGSGAASRAGGVARIGSRLWRSRVTQTVKIIVVSWQIITQASEAKSAYRRKP